MERRLFVKNLSLAIPATILLPGLLTSCKKDKLGDTDWDGKIIVIGAGVAGLYAGNLIRQYAPNAQLQILEASNQRGGRIRELTGFADFPIELGAEEVHGNKTDWYATVKNASGVNFVNSNNTTDYYVIDDLLKSEDDLTADTDVIAANVFIEQAGNYNGADQSVKDKADADNLSQRIRPYVNAQTGNEYGTDYSILSIKGIAEEDQLWTAGDDNYAVANRSYISIMQEAFADAWDKVLLNTQVKKIDYTSNTIVLTDQNNQTYTCDKLVITIPLAVLKAGDVEFLPTLPTNKTDAIANIGIGPGMKIVLKFNNRFWADDLGSLYGSGNVPEIWYPSLGRGNTQVLTCFVMGYKAATLSALGNGAVQNILAELDAAFGNNAATSSFVDAYIMDWGKEPFIKGAYSFPVVGGGITKRQALASKLNNNIFFAGEATHTKGHSGTVHGAVETGYRAVKEFIESVE